MFCSVYKIYPNSLITCSPLPDKSRNHNTKTRKILMVFKFLIGKKLSLLNQIHRESCTSKTVTLRHDERCAFLRITWRITQSSRSGVESLLQRSCKAFTDRIAVRHTKLRVGLSVKLRFLWVGKEGRASPDSGGLLALQTSPIRLMYL